jgi:hypothetical protein
MTARLSRLPAPVCVGVGQPALNWRHRELWSAVLGATVLALN